MHGYSAYAIFARDVHDTDCVPYYCALMQSFSKKAVLFSEFGNPTCPSHPATHTMPCLHEDEMPPYAIGVLDKLHARGALGALWWCWGDYTDELDDLPPFDDAPHELTFGLVRSDGSYKPIADALAAFAREKRTVVSTKPVPIESEERFYLGLPQSICSGYERFVG